MRVLQLLLMEALCNGYHCERIKEGNKNTVCNDCGINKGQLRSALLSIQVKQKGLSLRLFYIAATVVIIGYLLGCYIPQASNQLDIRVSTIKLNLATFADDKINRLDVCYCKLFVVSKYHAILNLDNFLLPQSAL